jgi:preprotein translocase subunit Sss1
MPTLQQQIVERFLAKLRNSSDVDAVKLEQLKALLEVGKKPKADEFIEIFSLPAGGDLK